MTDLRSILESRCADLTAKIEERTALIKDLAASNRVDLARVEEIGFALEQLPAANAVHVAAPVETPKPKEKSPSEAFADHLIEHFGFDGLPDTVDDLCADFPKPRNSRTLRAGLELALQRRLKSRAGGTGPDDAHQERNGARSSSEPSPNGGAGVPLLLNEQAAE